MKKTRCPYCGKKLNYFQAFAERKRGEHSCSHCGRNSTIFFSKSYKIMIGIAILLAIVLVVISINPYFIGGLWGMLWVALPFLILYLITPFFLKLVPLKKKNNIDIENVESSSDSNIDNHSTKTINKLDRSYFDKESKFEKSDDDSEFLDISELNL